MKKILVFIFSIIFLGSQQCLAENFKVLVLPDNIFSSKQEYMVYPESAELIASDVINFFNKSQRISSPTISSVSAILKQNTSLTKETIAFLNKYKTTYLVDFESAHKIAAKFNAQRILLVSCHLDTQNYFLRRTLWDALNISGATVTDPAYRLSTQVTLIDTNNQIILWQENFHKLISSRENRIVPITFAPAGEQLEKIKRYSTRFLAPQIVQETQLALFNVSEYADFRQHPEILTQQTITIDRVKIQGRRNAVKTGRKTKQNIDKTVKDTKKKFADEQEKFRQKQQVRQQKKQSKNIEVVEIMNTTPASDTEKDVTLPQLRQEIKPVPYIRTKPRLREDNSTINDL